jgi:NAD(P)-dependent dehydrogenase (short-subunit alcohol dehydrogenase family)
VTTLAGQTVLVAAANRGIGREYVTQLLGRGVATVYAAARNADTIKVNDSLVVVALRLDAIDAASVAAATGAVTDVSVLINNAGIAGRLRTVLGAGRRDDPQVRAQLGRSISQR